MSGFDDLKAAVTANNSLLASAKQLIGGIADRIKQAGTDPAELQALTDSLKASDADLAQAIAANTPAAVSATPAPAPAGT